MVGNDAAVKRRNVFRDAAGLGRRQAQEGQTSEPRNGEALVHNAKPERRRRPPLPSSGGETGGWCVRFLKILPY